MLTRATRLVRCDLFLGTPESHTGKMGGRAMVLVLEINFAVWGMIGCLAGEAFQLTM
jgi:hypothetical protein